MLLLSHNAPGGLHTPTGFFVGRNIVGEEEDDRKQGDTNCQLLMYFGCGSHYLGWRLFEYDVLPDGSEVLAVPGGPAHGRFRPMKDENNGKPVWIT